MPLIHTLLLEVYPNVNGALGISDTYLAGPGGSVLANRLSENPNNRVLLIEAGPRSAHIFLYVLSGAELPQRYGRSFRSHPIPLHNIGAVCCLMELYHGPTDWFGRALDRISSRTHSWWLHFDQYVGSRSEAMTRDLVFPRLYGLDAWTSERL
jgi:choline dehydrogenase-like flavoprotein